MAVVVLFAAASLLGDVAPADAAFPGGNGLIAFTSARDGNANIFAMNANGTVQGQRTSDPASDTEPAWSPDGSKLAFVSDRDWNGDPAMGRGEIYVMNANGTVQSRLTSNAVRDSNPSWSPDGTKIVFTQQHPLSAPDIYVMNADGTNQRRLTDHVDLDDKPAWSPDGSKIAFTSRREGGSEIWAMNADGSAPTRLTNSEGTNDDAAWSPDGSKIAFESDRSGTTGIYVMAADGTVPARLTSANSGTAVHASWSPDGTQIAYAVKSATGTQDVFVMNADGTAPARLTTSGDNLEPDWQRVVTPAPRPAKCTLDLPLLGGNIRVLSSPCIVRL